MQHVTFRQLEVFSTVARYGSFTRAAEVLALTQPTVSMQIRRLAEEVGMPLFETVGKRVRLTEAGTALLTTCRDIFAARDRFELAIHNLHGLHSGTLRLAAVNTAKYFAPLLLGVFCRRHPGIDVQLTVGGREEVLQRLSAQQDDLCIMSDPPEHGSERIAFLDNPLVVIAPPSHALAAQPAIDPAQLLHEPWLLREATSGTRRAVDAFFRERGLQPRIRMELPANEAIRQGVIAGLGLAVLARQALGNDLEHGRLVVLDVAGFPLRRQWFAVLPAQPAHSVLTQAFVEFLRQDGAAVAQGQTLA